METRETTESAARRRAAQFDMKTARRRHRREKHAGPFRAWATRTYNAFACRDKLAAIVGRKDTES